jgi:hypothetical protein
VRRLVRRPLQDAADRAQLRKPRDLVGAGRLGLRRCDVLAGQGQRARGGEEALIETVGVDRHHDVAALQSGARRRGVVIDVDDEELVVDHTECGAGGERGEAPVVRTFPRSDDSRVGVVQFACHALQREIELRVGPGGQHAGPVLVPYGDPVHAVQAGVVVALRDHLPRTVLHLEPLGFAVERRAQADLGDAGHVLGKVCHEAACRPRGQRRARGERNYGDRDE